MQAAISLSKRSQDRQGVVSRPIVDSDNFKRLIVLSENGTNRVCQHAMFFITRWNDYRYRRALVPLQSCITHRQKWLLAQTTINRQDKTDYPRRDKSP